MYRAGFTPFHYAVVGNQPGMITELLKLGQRWSVLRMSPCGLGGSAGCRGGGVHSLLRAPRRYDAYAHVFDELALPSEDSPAAVAQNTGAHADNVSEDSSGLDSDAEAELNKQSRSQRRSRGANNKQAPVAVPRTLLPPMDALRLGDHTGQTPLALAIRHGSLECVRLLFDVLGAEALECYGKAGETILHDAVRVGRSVVVAEVLKFGDKVWLEQGGGDPRTHVVNRRSLKPGLAPIAATQHVHGWRMLLAHPQFLPTGVDVAGNNLFHTAAQYGPHTVQLLLGYWPTLCDRVAAYVRSGVLEDSGVVPVSGATAAAAGIDLTVDHDPTTCRVCGTRGTAKRQLPIAGVVDVVSVSDGPTTDVPACQACYSWARRHFGGGHKRCSPGAPVAACAERIAAARGFGVQLGAAGSAPDMGASDAASEGAASRGSVDPVAASEAAVHQLQAMGNTENGVGVTPLDLARLA